MLPQLRQALNPTTKRECGACTMCCKTMGVPELSKPAHKWCVNCNVGKGCNIYPDRPASCREFECVWLQDRFGVFTEKDRPDKVGVVLQVVKNPIEGNKDVIIAHCDPNRPTAWRNAVVFRGLKALARAGYPVSCEAGKRFWIITGTTEWEAPPELIETLPNGMTYIRVPAEIKAKIGLFA